MDTYCNITNNKEMRKGDLWKNNTQLTQDSDFNLLSVNDIFSAYGNGIEKAQSFPSVSKTFRMEGKLHIFSVIFRYKGIYNIGFMNIHYS